MLIVQHLYAPSAFIRAVCFTLLNYEVSVLSWASESAWVKRCKLATIAQSCAHGAEELRIVASALWNACILMIPWIDSSLLTVSNTANSMTVVVVAPLRVVWRHGRLTLCSTLWNMQQLQYGARVCMHRHSLALITTSRPTIQPSAVLVSK